MNIQSLKNALWISALYLIFGLIWIYFSDSAVASIASDSKQLTLLQTYKGWFFIAVTTTFLFLLSYRFFYDQFITYSKHLEEQLILQNKLNSKDELLRQTNHLAKIGGWEFDPISNIGLWTDELAYIHDVDPNEKIDVKRGIDFFVPSSRPLIEKAIQEAVSDAKPYDLELEIITAKGVHKWVRTIGSPIVLEGKVVKVRGVLQDITKLKLSEIESKQSTLKYQNLFETSRDALMTSSPYTGKFTKANQATLKLFGVDSEAAFLALGPSSVSPPFQPDGQPSEEKAKQMIAIALEKGSHFFEWTHQRLNGETFIADILLTRMDIEGQEPFVQGTVRDISDRKEYEKGVLEAKEKFNKLAHHDPLTSLPNRLSLIEKLQIKTRGTDIHPFALFFLDLDGFKEINDSYGHRFGDELLIRITQLLQEIFPPDTFIVRTGGDEFVILLECHEDKKIIQNMMQRLTDILNHPIHIKETDVYITASIGIAMYPSDADNPEELLQKADTAMYNAKKMGKNTYSFYTLELTERALQHTTLSTQLKKALQNDELQLHFQPQVDSHSGKIIGVEALLRWTNGETSIPPSVFIPIAEESGLIIELGEFVLKQGFLRAAVWSKERLLPGRIAINVSARQLTHIDFLMTLDRIIQETQCHPSLIELEITESSILENPEKIIALLWVLKTKGFNISIDDFGTGYSSLSYLKNLPIDKLKIDISFVRNITHEPKNQSIVKTIIALAKGLNMEVLAEGVESVEEVEFLRENGVDSIQGFYYYKPISFDSMEALLLS